MPYPEDLIAPMRADLTQYGVEEAVASGVENIILVTSRGKSSMEDHFDVSIELETLLESRGKKELLEEVRLFDVYTGPQVGENRKSLTFALRFRATDRTLTEDEASAARDAAVRRADEQVGAVLRS